MAKYVREAQVSYVDDMSKSILSSMRELRIIKTTLLWKNQQRGAPDRITKSILSSMRELRLYKQLFFGKISNAERKDW